MSKKGRAAAKQEADYTLLPSRGGDERIYGLLDQVAVQLCFGIAAWDFLTGAQTGLYLPAHEAIPTILMGNIVPLFVICAVGFYSARFGLDSMTSAQGCFGSKGPAIIVVLFACQLIVSAAMPMLLFGQLATKFSGIIGFPEWLSSETPGSQIWALSALALGLFIAYSGPIAMKWVSRVSAVFMFAVIAYLLYYLFADYGFSYVWNAEPREPMEIEGLSDAMNAKWTHASALETNLGLGFSWAFMFGMFTRLGKTKSKGFQGCFWGWGLASCAAIVFSAFVALATGEYDPSSWIVQAAVDHHAIGLAIIGLLFMSVANISSIAMNTYPGAIAITARWPKVSWLIGVLIIGVPTVLLLNPEVYYRVSSIYSIVGLLTSLFAGVVVFDTLFISKGRISMRAMFNRNEGYYFWHGINPAGFIALGCGFIIYLLILNPITWTSLTGLFPYTCAAPPTFIGTGLIYTILMKCWVLKKYPVPFLNNIKNAKETGNSEAVEA